MNYIPLFYYLSNNFGDAMSHYLTAKISGKQPVLLDRNDDALKYMVTGSILNNDIKNAIVWGCGVAWSNDKIPAKTKILAVRGKLTGELCKKQGVAFDEVYGDPAVLMPMFYNPVRNVQYKLGIIPHYVDLKIVYDKLGMNDEQLKQIGIKIINPLDDVESVVDQIVQCEKTISSTLHGLITAHAYGVPSLWTKFSNGIGGDDFKYLDYLSTTNAAEKKFCDLRSALDIAMIKNICDNVTIPVVSYTESIDKLYNACPFKK